MSPRSKSAKKRRPTDELPSFQEMLCTPTKKSRQSLIPFKKGSLVWAKCRAWVPWPAIITRVVDRQTCRVKWFPESLNTVKNGYRISTKNLQDYDAFHSENSVNKPTNNIDEFQKAIAEADKLHTRLVNGEHVSLDETKTADTDDNDSLFDDSDLQPSPSGSDTVVVSAAKSPRVVQRRKQNRQLVDVAMKSKKLKDRLISITKGTAPSCWKDLYAKSKDKRPFFGPIVEEDLMEQLSSKLATLYEEEFLKKKSIEGDEFDFVMQVWVPEAICFALKLRQKMSESEAIDAVTKPGRFFPEEVAEMRREKHKSP